MVKIRITRLHERAKDRPAGYLDDVLSRAARRDENGIYLTEAAYNELLNKYSPGASFGSQRKNPCGNCGTYSSGIGDWLKAAVHRRWGASPCSACRQEVAMLNVMTPERAMAEAPALAKRMAQRWEQLPKWWQRVAVRLALKTPLTKSMVEAMLLSMIRDAIQAKSK